MVKQEWIIQSVKWTLDRPVVCLFSSKIQNYISAQGRGKPNQNKTNLSVIIQTVNIDCSLAGR